MNGQIITLNGNQIYVGVSDIIDVQNSILNLDIGLIEKTGSNLKLDKYIENVTVEIINFTTNATVQTVTINK